MKWTNLKTKLMVLATTPVLMATSLFASEGSPVAPTVRSIDLTGIDLMASLDQIYALLPQVLPAVFGFIALRKGISFLLSSVRGA